MHSAIDYNRQPLLVVWEVTRACSLACVHCRAVAQPHPHPLELTTAEGFKLIDEIKKLGAPIVIFSGGDPLTRTDIFELIKYSKSLGLIPNLSPSGTKLLTPDVFNKALKAGTHTISLSIDGPTSKIHDAFRGVAGTFERTTKASEWVIQSGLRLQINTVISSHNILYISQMADLVERLSASRWEVFYLVPTGRAQNLTTPTAEEYEKVSHELYKESRSRAYQVAVIEGQFYRRIVIEEMAKEKNAGQFPNTDPHSKDSYWFRPGINSGKGFLFVSHLGNIYPSGFLPLDCGNVRKNSLTYTYRNHPVFKKLRDHSQLEGLCRVCKYKEICGGSRARAYAVTNNFLAGDPFCSYNPQ